MRFSNCPAFWRNIRQESCPRFQYFGGPFDYIQVVHNFRILLEDWTSVPCPIFQDFAGRLDSLKACLIFPAFWRKIGQLYTIQSSRILEEGWTICQVAHPSCFLEEDWTTILPKLPALWRKFELLPGCPNLLHKRIKIGQCRSSVS